MDDVSPLRAVFYIVLAIGLASWVAEQTLCVRPVAQEAQ
jgi:hypothetical protein